MTETPDPASQSSYREAIRGMLRQLPAELQQAARLAAIPHRFNAELFEQLLNGDPEAERWLAEMRRFGLVQESSTGWFTFQELMRAVLLSEAQSQEALYRPASRQASAYFHARLEQAGNPNPEIDLLEYLYHQVAADEASGLEELRRYFESFWRSHHAGLANHLLQYVREQQAVLSPSGRDWLSYLEARQGQAGQAVEASLNTFRQLASTAESPLLRATARRSSGEALAQMQQCGASIDELNAALREFEQLGDPLETASTQADLGGVFVTLAEAAGGLREETPGLGSRLERLVYQVQHAPFLIYRWFSRRFEFVPNLYYGTDYQNWIIIRYLYSAIHWFERAARNLRLANTAGRADLSTARIQIQIRLADLYQRTGRWSRAARLYRALSLEQPVQADPYLQALVQLGRGSLLLASGSYQPAMTLLETCRDTFQPYGDLNSVGKAARLIGQARARMGEVEAAASEYRQATEAFYQTHDLLNATETRLRALSLMEKLSPTAADAFAAQYPRLAFTERFPDRTTGFLHRLFRGFAAYVVLPLTYFLMILLAYYQLLWTAAGEMLVHAAGEPSTTVKLLADLSAALPFLILMPALALWIYEGLYAVAGVFVARWLPYALITRQQALYFILDEQTLGCYDPYGRLVDFIPWPEITLFASLDRRIWRQPLTLFSSFLVGSEDKSVIVDGIVNRYLFYKRETGKRVQALLKEIHYERLDFALLDRRRGMQILLATVLLTSFSILTKFFVPNQGFIYLQTRSQVTITLYATEVAFQFWKWLIITGPLFSLVQLLQNHRAIHQRLGKRLPPPTDWPIWVGVIFLTIMMVGEIVNLFLY